MAASTQGIAFSLVYISQAVPEFSLVDEELQKKALASIAGPSEAKNKRLNVRGILLSAAGYFIQWLEGDEGVVRKLMATIAADPRHTNVQIAYTGYRHALLTDWSMSLVVRTDVHNSMLKQIKSLPTGVRPRSAGSVPAGMILSIICPSVEVGIPEGRRRRILLLGQSAIWSAALLEHLSRQFKSPIAHARLLGSNAFERRAILEYLDIDHPRHGPLRLLNPSGDVESVSWMTGIKEKLTACVLFYSQNSPQALSGFTSSVHSHLGSTNEFTPVLCLFGRTAAPLVQPVLDWFAASRNEASAEQITLADSDAVWRAVEELLDGRANSGLMPVEAWDASVFPEPSQPAVLIDIPIEPMLSFELTAGKLSVAGNAADTLDRRKVQQIEAAIPLPVIEPLEVLSSPTPVVKAQTSAAAAVVSSLTSLSTSPISTPAQEPLLALSASGKQLLQALLKIDNACFAGAQCLKARSQVVLKGAALDGATGRELAEEGFANLLRSETLIHQALIARLSPVDTFEGPQVSTRTSSHFNFSFTVGQPAAAVVLVHMREGTANEALVRFTVLALLNKSIGNVFESA